MQQPTLSDRTVPILLTACVPLGMLLGLLFPDIPLRFNLLFACTLLTAALATRYLQPAAFFLICFAALGLSHQRASSFGKQQRAARPNASEMGKLFRIQARVRSVSTSSHGLSLQLEQVSFFQKDQELFRLPYLTLYAPFETPEPAQGSRIRAWITLKSRTEPRTLPWPMRELRRKFVPNLFATLKSSALMDLEQAQVTPSALNPANRQLIRALLRNQSAPIWAERLRHFGIGHLLSVSGLHCAIFYLMLQILLAPLRRPFLRAALAILAILGFATWMRWSPSVTRASMILALWVLLPLLNRPRDWLAIWAGLFVLSLFINPLQLLNRGFWYTYVASLGLLLGRRPSQLPTPLQHPWLAVMRPLLPMASAQILVVPINLLFDSQAQLLSIFWNLIGLAFLICLLLLLLLALLGAQWPSVALLANHLDQGFAQLFQLIDVEHAAFTLYRFPFPVLASFFLVLNLIALLRLAPSEWRWYGAIVLLCLALCAQRPKTPGQVWMLDVGQGLSLLHVDQKGDGHLFDAGGRLPSGVNLQTITRLYGAKRLESIVISHPHADHYNLLTGLNASQVWGNKEVAKAANIEALKRLQVQVPRPGQQLEFGDLTAEVLGPVRANPPDLNEGSLALLLRAPKWELLFAADAGYWAEPDWHFPQKTKLRILQIGHHGSRTATSLELLQRFKPDLALISCGEGNMFAHPHPLVLKRLQRQGIPYKVTAREGTIWLACSSHIKP